MTFLPNTPWINQELGRKKERTGRSKQMEEKGKEREDRERRSVNGKEDKQRTSHDQLPFLGLLHYYLSVVCRLSLFLSFFLSASVSLSSRFLFRFSLFCLLCTVATERARSDDGDR